MEVIVAFGLVVVAVAVSRLRRLRVEKDLLIAAGRAVVQLFVLAAVVQAVLGDAWLSSALVAVMIAAATMTSSRRLAAVPRAPWIALASIAGASLVAMAVLVAGGVLEREPRVLIPIAGMLVGNSMTATSLAGARLRDDLTAHALELEARLALGVRAGEALRGYVARASVTALIPTIDSTKNVGLVFLPGAFVGMMLAGASVAEAARLQLVVLFMLLGAVSLAGLVTTSLVARAFVGEGERIVLPPARR